MQAGRAVRRGSALAANAYAVSSGGPHASASFCGLCGNPHGRMLSSINDKEVRWSKVQASSWRRGQHDDALAVCKRDDDD